MALNPTALASEIADELQDEFGDSHDDEQRQRFCAAIARAVVAHIKANATLVIKPAHVGLQTTSTAGAATAGPAAPVTAIAPVID